MQNVFTTEKYLWYNTQNLNLSNSWSCFTLLNFITLIFGTSVA